MFGQLVIGALGSGKTTYVKRTYEYYAKSWDGDEGDASGMTTAMGPNKPKPRRPVIVNLDPANEFGWGGCGSLKPDIDINQLITVKETMAQMGLGPNGSIVYCMEYLEAHTDWLIEALRKKEEEFAGGVYFIFDLPGQAEIVTHHESLMRVVKTVAKRLDFRFVAIHLVDSTHVRDVSKFISVALVSLVTMMRLELPHLNVLSKFDLIRDELDTLDLPLEFYTEMGDPMHLTQFLERGAGAGRKRYRRLVSAICELLEEYSLVSFTTLCVREDEDLERLLKLADRAIGYA